jgi:hypothetical protein
LFGVLVGFERQPTRHCSRHSRRLGYHRYAGIEAGDGLPSHIDLFAGVPATGSDDEDGR